MLLWLTPHIAFDKLYIYGNQIYIFGSIYGIDIYGIYGIYDIYGVYMVYGIYIYMVIKTEQLCISFEISFSILNLFYSHMTIFIMLRTIRACSFL